MHFLKKTLQRFASKTQNDSKAVEKFKIIVFKNIVFVQLVYFLNRFGVRMMANIQQRLNSLFSMLLKVYLQTSVEKRRKI